MVRRISSQNIGQDQRFSLFETFNKIPVNDMGFPDNWKKDNFWNKFNYFFCDFLNRNAPTRELV